MDRRPLTGRMVALAVATVLAVGAFACGRDESRSAAPGAQTTAATDRDLTQRVRQAISSDDSLSTSAKNVQIATNDGTVTLRGAVQSPQERQVVAAKAKQIAGAERVDDQLQVASNGGGR